MATVKVLVTGAPKTGKTTVALAIEASLHGLGLNPIFKDQDGPLLAGMDWTQRLGHLRDKGLQVEIVTASEPHPNSPAGDTRPMPVGARAAANVVIHEIRNKCQLPKTLAEKGKIDPAYADGVRDSMMRLLQVADDLSNALDADWQGKTCKAIDVVPGEHGMGVEIPCNEPATCSVEGVAACNECAKFLRDP